MDLSENKKEKSTLGSDANQLKGNTVYESSGDITQMNHMDSNELL